MRIAFIVSKFPSLSETFILNQVTGLIDRGHEVDIYASHSGTDPKIHPDVELYNLLQHTFYFGKYYSDIPANIVLRLLKSLYLVTTNFHKKPLALMRSFNVFKYKKKAISLRNLLVIIPFLDMKQYDVINCHFGANGNIGALLKDLGIIKGKLVTTFHGYDITKHLKLKGKSVYNSLFAMGDLFLPISERWKNKLIELGCNKDKIVVHRMGIDTSQYSLSPLQLKNADEINILTVARLVEKKGVRYGIRAVAKVVKKIPNIKYKIVGDGILRAELENMIEELNLQREVEMLGWMQQDEIVKLMKESDILLAPSVTAENGDQEGIPVVLMEAMAQGLPVVSTYHSGIPELVQDGVSGFLVPERDVDSLALKLEYLIEHQDEWSDMSRAGRAYVEEKYDINSLNDQLTDIYQELLHN